MTDTDARNRDLRSMLSTRRRQLQDEVQKRLHNGCPSRTNEVADTIEHSDADIQAGMDLALLEMRTESLIRIDEALVRLDAGEYGSCFECSGDISERRLRALPFAVRCHACEERREREQAHARKSAQRRAGFSLFPEMAGA